MLQSSVDILRHEFQAHGGEFWWMVWNAMLAFIPVLMATIFFKRADQPRHGIRDLTFGFELALVLLFLPNAPYIATDLVHFLETVRQGDESLWELLWSTFPVYFLYVLFGLTCYSFTTDRLLFAIRVRLGRAWAWAALGGIPLLATIGIYLGRVARYNSWDILTHPRGIIHSSRGLLGESRVLNVLLAIWLSLIVVHQVYRTFHDGLRTRFGNANRGTPVG